MQVTQVAKQQWLQDGNDFMQVVGPGGKIVSAISEKGGIQVVTNLLATDGAINPRQPGFYVITKGSAAALTLAAPVVGTDDGLEIEITVGSNFAHVITATGLLLVAGAAGNPKNSITAVTTNTAVGTTAYLTAYQGQWFYATGGIGTWTVA